MTMAAKRPRTARLIADTLELMALHDKTAEYGECVVWTAGMTKNGHPLFKRPGHGCTLVRRMVWELMGHELKRGVPIIPRCGDKTCIRYGCLKESSASEVATIAGKRGAFSSHARGAKIAAARRKDSKLTIEIAREIRMSTESGPVLAARHGVHRRVINNIKSGLSWKDYANPFAALMR